MLLSKRDCRNAAVSFFLSVVLRCWIYQSVLKAVGTGTENISRDRLLFADIQIQLNPLRTVWIVGDGISKAGDLFSTGCGEIKPLGILQLVIREVGFLQFFWQKKLKCLHRLRLHFPAHGLKIGPPDM